jgi:hypothetical protein
MNFYHLKNKDFIFQLFFFPETVNKYYLNYYLLKKPPSFS